MTSFLKKRADYLHIYRSGKKTFQSEYIKVFGVRNDLDGLRVGMTISTAVGTAVVRNKLKRWVREYFKSFSGEAQCFDLNIVILGKSKKFWQEIEYKKFLSMLEQAVEVSERKFSAKK